MMEVKLSVKTLVEFLYQSGDLRVSFFSPQRANIGSRIHRMLQKQGGDHYESEVFLKEETDYDQIHFMIDGRADGIITIDDQIILDEIKTCTCDYDEIHEDLCFKHWAQAYGYAYIYAKQHDIAEIIVQLTYYQIDINEKKQFRRNKTFVELQTFYMDMLAQYASWAKRSSDFKELRNASIATLDFPFPSYRKGQRELAVAVYKTIVDGDILFAQAPTGIGKTISTLFPALKALQEQKINRIFYLCAKNITATVAQDSILTMAKQGLRLKCVHILAKDKMCLLDERNCDPQVCPYAQRYYDKLRPVLEDMLYHHDNMDKDIFQSYGKMYEVCPFELSLDAALYSDCIICDYNYAFDPRVYLKRFFLEPQDYLFLIDEAHNMVDRARSMYSAQLSKSLFAEMKKLIGNDGKKLKAKVNAIIKKFNVLLKQMNDVSFQSYSVCDEDFLKLCADLQKEADAFFLLESEHKEEIRTLYFDVLAFLRIAEFYDDHYVTWIKKEERDGTIKLFCRNPCRLISQTLKMGKAAVFFSATLTPIAYFTSLLLEEECQKKIALPSPFDAKKAKLLIHRGIDTRYRVREHSLQPICETIYASVSVKQGNYIVFFPSYAYLKQCAALFAQLYPHIRLHIQRNDMNEQERSAFLSLFDKQKDTMICFCVLGGMFSEGIDFKGEKLIGVFVVGVGLPQINEETDLLKQYFDETLQKGYAYAYQYPGMNKVLQACGRLIRSVEDKGVIVLLDNRYATQSYRALFPLHMRHYEMVYSPQECTAILERFWKDVNE